MAEVSQRTWKIPGQRMKRKAWGFTLTTMVDGKRTRTKNYRAEWSKEQAEEALAKALLKVEAPKAQASGITFGAACEKYLAAKARKKSVAEIGRVLNSLKAYFGADTPLSEITANRISQWQAERLATMSRQTAKPLSLASINHPMANLRGVLRMAHQRWEVLEKLPQKQHRLRWLTPEEADRLLAACRASRNTGLVDLVEFCMFTGLRQAEALELTWDRVDRSRGVVLMEITKSNRRREVPLNSRADAALLRRVPREGAGLVFGAKSFDHFRSAWERAVRHAKVPDFRFHDLRHTFASWAVQRGATLQEIKDLLGHSSLAMVLRYAHLAPEHLRTAVSRLDGIVSDAPVPAEITSRRAQGRAQEHLQLVGGLRK